MPSPRAVLATAALGAALVAGLTGGTAAHAAEQDPTVKEAAGLGVTTTERDPAVKAATGLGVTTTERDPAVKAATGLGAVDDPPAATGIPVTGDRTEAVDAAIGRARPPAAATASRGAQAVRKKNRPRPVVTTSTVKTAVTDATWVNPLPAARTTSCFGPRWGRLHAGVDLAAPHGTPIVAAGAGVVVRAGEEGGYGNAVLLDHGNGYLTHYGHMSAITVRDGQRVHAGEQIGNEGSTGHSTGPHLHFEVHADHYKNPIEPTRWLADRGVTVTGC